MQIKALIVDDEPLARKRLRRFLSYEPDVEIVGESADGIDALKTIRAHQPDVVLLDIRLPNLNGVDLANELTKNKHRTKIVFTTAHEQYALQAFESAAADYLLKPFGQERFRRTLQRVRGLVAAERALAFGKQVASMAGDLNHDQSYLKKLVFKSGTRLVILPVSDLTYVAAEGNYAKLHSISKPTHLLRITMADLLSKLDPASFTRIHRSTIVNMEFVKEIKESDAQGHSKVTLTDGTTLCLSRHYKREFYGSYRRELRS